jgi:hypothetical protein
MSLHEYTFNICREGNTIGEETATHHRVKKNTYIFLKQANICVGDEINDKETGTKYKVVGAMIGTDSKGERLIIDLKTL